MAIPSLEIRATQYGNDFPYVDFSTLPQETIRQLIQSINFPSSRAAEIKTVDLSVFRNVVCVPAFNPSDFSKSNVVGVSREGWIVASLVTTIIDNLYRNQATNSLLKDREKPDEGEDCWTYPCPELHLRKSRYLGFTSLLKVNQAHRNLESVLYTDTKTKTNHTAIFGLGSGGRHGIFSVIAYFLQPEDEPITNENQHQYAGKATITIAFKSELSSSMKESIKNVLLGITTVVAASSSMTAAASSSTAATAATTAPAATAAADSRKRKLADD